MKKVSKGVGVFLFFCLFIFSFFALGKDKVEIQLREVLIQAEKINVNLEKEEIEGWGNISLELYPYKIRGEALRFNLKDEKGYILKPEGREGPFIFKGKMAFLSPSRINVERGYFTTCDLPSPHYHIKAKKIEFYVGEKVIVRDAFFYLGSVPLFWSPLYVYYLKKKNRVMLPDVGYSKVAGGYVKAGYIFYPFKDTEGVFRLEYRKKKGWATGLELNYSSGKKEGDASLYCFKEKNAEALRGIVRVKYFHFIPTSSLLKLNIDYLSDKDILDEYFSNLPFEERQIFPSFFALDLRKGEKRFFLQIQKRFNDFDDYYDILPRLKLNLLHPSVSFKGLYVKADTEFANFLGDDSHIKRLFSSLDFSYPLTFLRYVKFEPNLGLDFFLYEENKSQKFNVVNYQELKFSLSFKGKTKNLSHLFSPTFKYFRLKNSSVDFPLLDWREEEAEDRELFEVYLQNSFFWKDTPLFYLNLEAGYDFLASSQKFKPVRIFLDIPFQEGRFYSEFLYDFYKEVFSYFKSGVSASREHFQISVDYVDDKSASKEFVAGTLLFDVGKNFSVGTDVAYDLKLGRAEKLGYNLDLKMHCLGLRLNIKEKPEVEWSAFFYITALPF